MSRRRRDAGPVDDDGAGPPAVLIDGYVARRVVVGMDADAAAARYLRQWRASSPAWRARQRAYAERVALAAGLPAPTSRKPVRPTSRTTTRKARP